MDFWTRNKSNPQFLHRDLCCLTTTKIKSSVPQTICQKRPQYHHDSALSRQTSREKSRDPQNWRSPNTFHSPTPESPLERMQIVHHHHHTNAKRKKEHAPSEIPTPTSITSFPLHNSLKSKSCIANPITFKRLISPPLKA